MPDTLEDIKQDTIKQLESFKEKHNSFNGWLFSFDDTHSQHIYADSLSEVLAYIIDNQGSLFGNDDVSHVKLVINRLTEDESYEYHQRGIVPQSWV